MKRILLYGVVGGVLVAALKWIEYKHFVHAYPTEIYGGLMAVIFTAVGIYVGLKWTRPTPAAEPLAGVATATSPAPAPLPTADRLKELGITPREHEILVLIAEGLSNR